MSIITLEGSQGTSKTTLAVALCYDDWDRNKRRIVSNNHLNLPNREGWPSFQYFDLAWFLEHLVDGELENCSLFLDEMYQIADNRSSQTKLNKLFTYFVVQTRKRDVDLYFCTHHIDHVDVRLRRAADIRGACKYFPEIPCRKCRCLRCHGTGKLPGDVPCDECRGVGGTGMDRQGQPCEHCRGYGVAGVSRGYFLDRRARQRYTIEVNAPAYWHIFNTKERIPFQAKILAGIDTLEVV